MDFSLQVADLAAFTLEQGLQVGDALLVAECPFFKLYADLLVLVHLLVDFLLQPGSLAVVVLEIQLLTTLYLLDTFKQLLVERSQPVVLVLELALVLHLVGEGGDEVLELLLPLVLLLDLQLQQFDLLFQHLPLGALHSILY